MRTVERKRQGQCVEQPLQAKIASGAAVSAALDPGFMEGTRHQHHSDQGHT